MPPSQPPEIDLGESSRSRHNLGQRIGLALGPLAFFAILLFLDLDPANPLATRMTAVAVLMAVWWITDAIPLAATALLPLVLFPLLGIMSGKQTAPIYINYVIFLFIGGFLIALAMEKWNLHKRIALHIIRTVGGGPARLVLAFMIASAFLSMWISNTATAIMMLAIGLAIIAQQEEAFGKNRTHNLSIALLLGIAYGCSIGGISTLVGTPPNLSFVRIFEQNFPNAPAISFGQWFLFAFPLSLILLSLAWLLITQVFFRSPKDLHLSPGVIQKETHALGPVQFAEKAVLAVFAATALLWVFRKNLTLGSFTLPGWSSLLPDNIAPLIDDGTVAITMALTLFLIPSRDQTDSRNTSHGSIININVFKRLPWHIVLLFGGGFALAAGFKETGLSSFVGQHFQSLAGASPIAMIATTTTTLTFLTELTSNLATTEMAQPILASVGVAMEINPLLLMIPATLAASCAFMMPVATPPNAIIFASGRIRVIDMVKIGLALNLLSILIITLLFTLYGTAVFQIDPHTPPPWSQP
jgi:sodium-dependent dicarboxylate transporter 2/3/5